MLHKAYDSAWAAHGVHTVFSPPQPLRLLGLDLVALNREQEPVTVTRQGAEMAIVVLRGTAGARVGRETWTGLGERASVFDGPATTLYVPPGGTAQLWAETDSAELAVCSAKADEKAGLKPFLVRPSDVEVVRRGQDHWRREVRNILTPDIGGDVSSILVGETVNDAGEWSGYPPHRHDRESEEEHVFEELYHYRLEPPDGFGIQVHYGADDYPDTGYLVRERDSFAIPSGYHPIVVQGGYRLYYLWYMAGPSGRTLRPFEDPRYRWVSRQG